MTTKTYSITLLLALFMPAMAQNSLPDEGRYRYDDITQLWRNTNNAAALGLDSARNRGIAYFDLSHNEGDYHRVQEGGMYNRLQFFTERYQAIGKYLYGYGKFSFDMGRTKGRAWSDVMRSYNSNPFFSGSSVPGKYDHQDIDLTATVGTISFNGWRYGLRLDYTVGDLSRLRDPRSRSQLLDYRLTPAISYTFGRQTLGLNAYYHRRKEKIPNISTVQNDPNLMYYLMSGMEHANGTTRGYSGYSREWVNHHFGAEIAYGYRQAGFHSVTAVQLGRGRENVYGAYKFQPGKYITYNYGLSTQNRLQQGKMIHQLDIKANYEQAYADEYRQELRIETDPNTGYNSYQYLTQITFKKRYQVNLLNLDLHYRANFTEGKEKIAHFIGFVGQMNHAKNKHLLPDSRLKHGAIGLTAEGGLTLADRLLIDANAGYHFSAKADMTLADPSTDYAVNVLQPDMAYYDANYWSSRLQVTYQFPLTFKGIRSMWFVKAYGNYLKTDNSMHRSLVGLSFGIYN